MTGSLRERPWRVALSRIALLGAFLFAGAQQTGPSDVPAPVVRVSTRLVLVDVIVTDKRGEPVTDLTAEDFTVLENGKPQQIAVFSREQPWGREDAKKLAEELPPLPPGVHTNRPEYRRPPGPPIVLLLDGLNTPVQDQVYVREKMLRFVADFLQPDQYMAVVAMGERLHLLQDFTTDPRLLITALKEWKAKSSVALANEERELDMLIAVAEALGIPISRELKAFQMQQVSSALEVRMNSTLSIFEARARALAGIPGRKNLIWVSAVFPFEFRPDEPRAVDQFRYWRDFAAPIRRLGRLLADARVAVYPVDARGLLDLGMGRAEERSFGTEPVRPSRNRQMGQLSEMEKRALAVSSPQQTMRAIAEETGGVAFYNRNDLDRAVAQGIEDGST